VLVEKVRPVPVHLGGDGADPALADGADDVHLVARVRLKLHTAQPSPVGRG
jgi:hypothetical protein